MTDEPKLAIGNEFYSEGQKWQVVAEPFLNDSIDGEQWWYPSRLVGGRNIKESLVDAPTEERASCGCEAEHLGPDGYGCKLNRTGTGALIEETDDDSHS